MFLRIHFAFDAVEQDSADAIQVPIDGAQGLVHNAGGGLRSMLGFIDQLQQVEILFGELAFALCEKIASDFQEFFTAGMRCSKLCQQLFIEQRGEAFFTVHESQDFKAGDPAGPAGEAAGVFVFRNEPAEIANAVLGRSDLVGAQRMIYVLDLTEPNGLFTARDFLIRDRDTIYVTEAPIVQWNRTIASITGTLSGASGLTTAATGGTLTE